MKALVIAVAISSAAGCAAGGEFRPGEDAGPADVALPPGPSVDEEVVLARARAFADGAFTRVHRELHTSRHAADRVQTWVHDDVLARYLSYDPDDPQTVVQMPPGAMLVMEHQSASGDADAITVMYKAEAGYAPDGGDWWWARVERDGTTNFTGRVGYCIQCHEAQSGADWIWGVRAADRAEAL